MKKKYITMYLKQLILSLIFILFAVHSVAQIDEGNYKGFKVKDKEEFPDVFPITVYSFGNGITQFIEAESKKPLQGKYHIIVHQNKYYIADFKKGIVDGDWEMYWYGSLWEKITFRAGKIDGKKYKYGSKGADAKYPSVYTYKNDVIQHYIGYYEETGQVQSEHFYDENGNLNGEMFKFDKDGKIVEEERYLHGRLNGKQIVREASGWVTQTEYVNGTLAGEYIKLFPNGNIKEKGYYDEKGKKTGQWVYGEEKGNITHEDYYLNDKLHGKQSFYFDNGKLKSIAEYTDGKLNGKYIYYDENPYAIARETSYVNGIMDGEFKVYSDGVLWREGISKDGITVYEKVYQKGKLQIVRALDENGNLENVEQYNTSSGKKTYQNKTYKKHASIKLKENASGVIDIE